jgi:NAD(P)-dependent dehydrogenase (short-subunit alcohol dehydrogenase family)
MQAGYQSYTCAMHRHAAHPPATDQARPLPGAALVTGGGRRLGAAIATALVESGWSVVLHCHRSLDEASALAQHLDPSGHRVRVAQMDLDQMETSAQAIHWLESLEQSAGLPLRLLVNNASRFEFDEPANASAQSLQRHHQTNLVAPVLLTQALYALRSRESTGSDPACVVNLLDQKLENLNPDFFSYTLSKSALLTANHLMARAFAPVLRVVGLSPGISLPSADQTVEEFDRAHRMTPLGASSHPHEIGQAVVWLAQARAITGINLPVDGGQHLVATHRDVMFETR